jgi:hypothetical protein
MEDFGFEIIDESQMRSSRSRRKVKYKLAFLDLHPENYAALLCSINHRKQLLDYGVYDEDLNPYAHLVSDERRLDK